MSINSYRKFNILYPWSWGNKNKSWCYNVAKIFNTITFKKSDRLKNLDYILKRSQQRVDRKDLLELETITEHLNKFLHVVREEYQLDLTDQHLKEIHTLLYNRIVLNRMLIIEMTKYFNKSSRVYLVHQLNQYQRFCRSLAKMREVKVHHFHMETK